MVSDSAFSYIHMDSQKSVLLVESWDNQKLRLDDIEFPADAVDQYDNLLLQFLSQNEEPETEVTGLGTNSALFNSSYANRTKQKSRRLNWRDMDLGVFQPNDSANQTHDTTILKRPEFGKYENAANLAIVPNFERERHQGSLKNGLNDLGALHQSSMNSEVGSDNEEDIEMEMDVDVAASKNISNPDLSRSFLHQFTTPVVNNRVYLHNFQNSAHRTASQQRRQSGDSNARNVSYHSPRHENIR